MGHDREELRRALGGALRRLREQGRFSLDDVQRGTTEQGVRVTRSHLSRVETGQAELSLPRFLALVSALGEPPARVIEDLGALMQAPAPSAVDALRRARAALDVQDPGAAAALLRAAAAGGADLGAAGVELWAAAEAALGRWSAAAHALADTLQGAADLRPGPILRLAVASIGSGRPGLARWLARAADLDGPRGWLVESAALLAGGPADEAAGLVAAEREWREPGEHRLALALVAEAHRRACRPRAALQAAEKAAAVPLDGAGAVEAQLALARAHGDLRRARAGLAALNRARPAARRLGCPDLLARCHLEAARLWTLAGDRDAARGAARAARAIRGRCGADRGPATTLPLHGLFELASFDLNPG
ncbi:MAG: helix-turn-helix transcriptional regulator [Acidobacteria bacterium]|nr:helix-turn-helix transcriptional regulator [Acidobacteriota bacterium]